MATVEIPEDPPVEVTVGAPTFVTSIDGITEARAVELDARVLAEAKAYADEIDTVPFEYVDEGDADAVAQAKTYTDAAVAGIDFPAPDVNKQYVDNADSALGNRIDTKSNTGHTHTPAQVGLGNVDNTSDVSKPISTAMQAALNTKVTAQTATNRVYFVNGSGVQTTLPVNATPTSGQIPLYSPDGQLRVGTPVLSDAAVTKGYLEASYGPTNVLSFSTFSGERLEIYRRGQGVEIRMRQLYVTETGLATILNFSDLPQWARPMFYGITSYQTLGLAVSNTQAIRRMLFNGSTKRIEFAAGTSTTYDALINYIGQDITTP